MMYACLFALFLVPVLVFALSPAPLILCQPAPSGFELHTVVRYADRAECHYRKIEEGAPYECKQGI